MLAFVQFPIADLRGFAPRGGIRPKRPEYPLKTGVGLPAQFVRTFGPAMRRRRGADYAFLDEQTFCSAARAIRFPKLPPHSEGVTSRLRCAFRRLFFDGRSIARVEVGLSYSGISENLRYERWDDDIEDGADPDWDSDADPFAVLDSILTLQTSVPYVVGKRRSDAKYPVRPLIMQGPSLARLYAQATTAKPAADDNNVLHDLVAPGNPLVIIECSAERLNTLPKPFVRIDPARIGGVELVFGRINRFGGDLGVWLAAYNKVFFETVRSVRLCLARLHAEQETLQAALAKLSSGALVYERDEPASELLSAYLNDATRVVDRKMWDRIEQSAIREAFEAAEATENRREIIYLRETLVDARKQIQRKVDAFERTMARRKASLFYIQNVERMVMKEQTITIGPGATVSAPVVIAESIQNSGNFLSNAAPATNDDVKKLVVELVKQVAELSKVMPAAAAVELARDTELLTREAVSPAPRRRWYELAIESIKNVATTVGDVGEPVLKTVGKLLPLLISLFP